MPRTSMCLQVNRILLIMLTSAFLLFSGVQLLNANLIRWPKYRPEVFLPIDFIVAIGLLASLIQHLKLLIIFSWLIATAFLLIFFGNTVSTNYQSDLSGMFYLLFVCIIAFSEAVCIIKHRLPSEDSHHPFAKCSSHSQMYAEPQLLQSQQQQANLTSEVSITNLPPPPHPPSMHHQIGGNGHGMLKMNSPSSSLPPPPPPLNSHCYASKNDPQFHAL